METNYQTTNIAGHRVLITGGTTGIGRQVALEIAAQGGNVLIAGRDQQHLDEVLKDNGEGGQKGKLNGIIADLSVKEGIGQLFEEVDRLFNGELDVLINNAALAYQSATEGEYEEWQEVVNTNLLGYIACTNEAVKRMEGLKEGHIINIGSMSADVREQGSSVYVATKAGIQGFSESLRKEVNEKGIRVTVIEPGAVNTDMQEQDPGEKEQAVEEHNMLSADDIAQAVLYALTQASRCDVVEIKLRPRLQLI